MKDDNFKILIKKSTLKASDSFTDELMMKLEAEKASLPILESADTISLGYPILIVLGIGVSFIFLWVFDLMPALNFMNYQLRLGSIPFMIIILLTFLIGVNYLLKLQFQAKLHIDI